MPPPEQQMAQSPAAGACAPAAAARSGPGSSAPAATSRPGPGSGAPRGAPLLPWPFSVPASATLLGPFVVMITVLPAARSGSSLCIYYRQRPRRSPYVTGTGKGTGEGTGEGHRITIGGEAVRAP